MSTQVTRVFVRTLASGLLGALALAAPAAAQFQTASTTLLFPRFEIAKNNQTEFRITNVGTAMATVMISLVCGADADGFCAGSNLNFGISLDETLRIDVDNLGLACTEGFAAASSDQPVIGSYEIGRGREQESGQAIANQGTGALAVDFRAVKRRNGSMLTLLDLQAAGNAVNPAQLVGIDFWSESGGAPTSTEFSFTCFAHVPLDDIDAGFLEKNLGSERGLLQLDPMDSSVIAVLSEAGRRIRAVRAPFVLP